LPQPQNGKGNSCTSQDPLGGSNLYDGQAKMRAPAKIFARAK
jgi:hypothetical protein